MRYGARFIAADHAPALLERGLLGGAWFEVNTLHEVPLSQLSAELLLMAPGGRRCLDAREIAVFKFPVTAEVELHSESLISSPYGGSLPEPSSRYPWRGNGFAPSAVERLENYLLPVPFPERTEFGRWSSGGFEAFQRFTRGQWGRL